VDRLEFGDGRDVNDDVAEFHAEVLNSELSDGIHSVINIESPVVGRNGPKKRKEPLGVNRKDVVLMLFANLGENGRVGVDGFGRNDPRNVSVDLVETHVLVGSGKRRASMERFRTSRSKEGKEDDVDESAQDTTKERPAGQSGAGGSLARLFTAFPLDWTLKQLLLHSIFLR